MKKERKKKKNLLMFLISYCLLTLDDERMDEKKEKCWRVQMTWANQAPTGIYDILGKEFFVSLLSGWERRDLPPFYLKEERNESTP